MLQKMDRRRKREEAYKLSEDLLVQRKMDGYVDSEDLTIKLCCSCNGLRYTVCIACRLVVVCKHHPEPVVMTLVNFLAPSRPFVVYCHLLEVSSIS